MRVPETCLSYPENPPNFVEMIAAWHARNGPRMGSDVVRSLSEAEVEAFIADGFVKIEGAFPPEVAEAARAILSRDLGCDPADPSTWTRPVVRLGLYGQEPFARAASTPVLQRPLDQLVGAGRWQPRVNLGTFPVRFPSPVNPATPAGTSTSASAPTPPISSTGGRTSPPGAEPS